MNLPFPVVETLSTVNGIDIVAIGTLCLVLLHLLFFSSCCAPASVVRPAELQTSTSSNNRGPNSGNIDVVSDEDLVST